jgi:hypothetical protein
MASEATEASKKLIVTEKKRNRIHWIIMYRSGKSVG